MQALGSGLIGLSVLNPPTVPGAARQMPCAREASSALICRLKKGTRRARFQGSAKVLRVGDEAGMGRRDQAIEMDGALERARGFEEWTPTDL